MDIISNDFDPDGGVIWLDGTIQPTHGDLYRAADNKVLYVPDLGFTGDDFFSYWIRDEEGNISRGEVSLRVGPGPIPSVRENVFFEPANFTELLQENIRPVAIQNRLAFGAGNSSFTVDLMENDHDVNEDELFLTSVYRSRGLRAVDIRLNNEGIVTGTLSSLAARGRTHYFYTISDGNKGNGIDDGFFPVFVERNNESTLSGQSIFGPSLEDELGSHIPYRITGRTNAAIEHLEAYTEDDLETIRVDSSYYDIGSVSFYVNGSLERVDNSAPFIFSYSGFTPGEHTLRIVATSETNERGMMLFDDRKKIQISMPTPPLTPIADSFVRGGRFEGVNYGSENTLTVRLDSRDESFERSSYLKFDIPRYADSDLVSATLRLRVESVSRMGNSHSVYSVDNDSWRESSITWNNRPPLGDLLSSDIVPDIGGWLELDVTSYVQAETSGDGIVSFAIQSDATALVEYHSREALASNQPQLVIETLAGAIATPPVFVDWAARNGLVGPNARALATPNGDGIPNLLKYAFNIEDVRTFPRPLGPGRLGRGLPNTFLTNGANKRLRVSFTRNNSDANLRYQVQFSSSLEAGEWNDLGREVSVTPIAPNWERVVFEDNLTAPGLTKRFGRVVVTRRRD